MRGTDIASREGPSTIYRSYGAGGVNKDAKVLDLRKVRLWLMSV
jgi:hypothetical protein